MGVTAGDVCGARVGAGVGNGVGSGVGNGIGSDVGSGEGNGIVSRGMVVVGWRRWQATVQPAHSLRMANFPFSS